jgi:hypothetical protein
MIRANFEIAGYVEFHDPGGRPWTVMLRRPGERPGGSRWGSWGAVPQMARRFVRDVTGDDRWNVEVIPAVGLTNLRKATIRASGATREAAVDAAIRLIGSLQSGKPFEQEDIGE